MSKKARYFPEAEKLYTIEQNTLAEIASKLPVSERTLRYWKEEGVWDEKKNSYLKSKKSFHEELYDFSRMLMKTIKNDWEEGEKVDSGRLYTLTRMLPLITKVKDYEDIRLEKEKPEEKQKGLSEDTIKEIEERFFGM